MGAMTTFRRPDGGNSRAYYAEAGSGRPGMVVIQEWWGLNDQIMGVADRFARAGYNALAPDLYKGRVASDANEASHLMEGLDFADATMQDLRGALDHLAASSRKVGVVGYCMGGALAIAAAVHLDRLAAAVPFYGIPPAEFADPARIRIPLQAHFAQRDDWCTPAKVDALEKALAAADGKFELYRYPAGHGFASEQSEAYDRDSANKAWQRMMTFLGGVL